MAQRNTRASTFFAVIVAACTVLGLAVAPAQAAPAAGEMTVTFVRHGESEGNVSGLVDTKIPGPNLTELGRTEALQVAALLSDQKFDGVYASRMVRSQQTAVPTAVRLLQPVVVEPGFHEILAGDYEGIPQSEAHDTYAKAPVEWLSGDLEARTPGAENGVEFKKRVDDSLAAVANSGKKNPVIFSHGLTIMVWSILSATNGGDYAANMRNDTLSNVGRVVLKGTPSTGWRIVEWVGSPDLPQVPACGGLVGVGSGSTAPC